MPAKLDRCVQELIKQGYKEEEAYAICKTALNLQKEVMRIATGLFIKDDEDEKEEEREEKEEN